MDQNFTVRTVHGKDAYQTYAKVHMDARTGSPLGRALAILLGLFIMAGGILATVYAGFNLPNVLTMIVGLLAIFARPVGIFRMTRRLLGSAENISMTIEYAFGPNGFTVRTGGETSNVSYKEVCKFFETDGYYFVYTGVRMAHILPKADFTGGDPAAFSAFLTERTKVPCVRRAY